MTSNNTQSPPFSFATEGLEEILLENLAIQPDTAGAIFLAFCIWYGSMFAAVVGFIIRRTNWTQQLDFSLHHRGFKDQRYSIKDSARSSAVYTGSTFDPMGQRPAWKLESEQEYQARLSRPSRGSEYDDPANSTDYELSERGLGDPSFSGRLSLPGRGPSALTPPASNTTSNVSTGARSDNSKGKKKYRQTSFSVV